MKYRYDWSLAPLTLGDDEYLIVADNRVYPAVHGWFDVVKRAHVVAKLDRVLIPPWASAASEPPRLVAQ